MLLNHAFQDTFFNQTITQPDCPACSEFLALKIIRKDDWPLIGLLDCFSCRVPDADFSVWPGRQQEPTIGTEVGFIQRTRLFECQKFIAVHRIPDPHRAVDRS